MSNIQVLFRYLIPSISTNLCIFLFGIVDGIFVGNGVGTNALGAINIVWPFIMLGYALNVLTSYGGTSLTAISIGENNTGKANEYFNLALYYNFIVSLLLALAGIFFTRPIVEFMGATAEYLDYAQDYLFWYCIFLVPNSTGVCLEHFCRNDNDPNLVLYSTLIATAVNIFLDYLLIFPLHMGITGAAIATGLSQTVRFFIVLSHFLRHKGILKINLPRLTISKTKEIFFQGVPEMLTQLSSPVTTLCMNLELTRTLGSLGINTYAVMMNIATVTLAIMYGCSEGIQPLFGQCYGAGQYRRLRYFLISGIVVVITGSIIFNVAVIVMIREICALFKTNLETTDYISYALPLYSWSFIIDGVNALISTFLYSIKKTTASIIFNISRSFIFNSLCIVGLPLIFGVSVIWFSKGIAEFSVLVIGLFMLYNVKLLKTRKKIE